MFILRLVRFSCRTCVFFCAAKKEFKGSNVVVAGLDMYGAPCDG